jgi:hypothetical protein
LVKGKSPRTKPLASRAMATGHSGRGKEMRFMQYPRIGGMDKSGEDLTGRRGMLMRIGALAIGLLTFVGVAQAAGADDDGYDDDGGGYYHGVWGGDYYDDDGWGGYYDDDDGWSGGYHDDDDWGDDD